MSNEHEKRIICLKCKKEIEADAVYCKFCGRKQERKQSRRVRSNGMGSAYKRGKTWTASIVIGWRVADDEHAIPVRRTKGGFSTKRDALEYCATLHGSTREIKITFAQLYEKWKPQYETRISSSTMRGHTAAYAWFKPIWYYDFVDICADDLQQCVDLCAAGRRTKENMKSLAMLLYKYAGANKIAEHNYAQYIYCGNEEKGTRPPFTTEEVEMIRQAIGKVDYADYVYCMIYTGFRPNEMLSLTVDAYDAVRKTLTGGFKTEAGKNRTVTISPKILMYIERQAKNPVYLFPRLDGKKMDDKMFREIAFNPIMEKLGIKDRVPYSCRHTFANLMKNVRGSDTDKAALIGHSDASMTKYYQSPDYESLRNITDNL